MTRRYNTRLITSRRSYTAGEIAKLLHINKQTVFLWLKGGLRPIEEHTKPLLIMGYELRRYLAETRKKRKAPLKENEYYCLKCRKATLAESGTEETAPTGKRIGKDAREQFIRRAKCEHCKTGVNRYV